MLDAKIPAFEVFTEFGDNASEDEILRIFLEIGDIDYVHRPICKAPERQIAHCAGVRDQSGAAGGDVGKAVANFSYRRDVMGAPALTVLLLHSLQHIAEPGIEIGARLN